MSDTRLEGTNPRAGTVLADRFEVHGVLGRGGTATVVLATDRLRGERLALKLVHPHLASDPATRRRLRREVQTASVLRSEAALVPHDLHELDGVLALSMPYHPGQTLLERVTTSGPLSPEEVRVLGVRLASALADAHRAGVLHRDVTPNNVLIGEDASSAVLTDFGLARLVLGGTRSTGLLGTAGYAAPEIYEGHRAEPRSDLYGLGAVLYLAATGSPPFDASVPMAALKQQLSGTFTPVREAARSKGQQVPEDLASLIERLLSPDPDRRPATARDVVDALGWGISQGPIEASARAASQVSAAGPGGAGPRRVAGRFLPPGTFTVVIRETEEDAARRNRLRAQGARRNVSEELASWGWHLADRVRDAIGLPAAPVLTPEEQLVQALASEMEIPAEVLLPSPVLRRRKFRLVDSTDEATAESLAAAARDTGFDADVVRLGEEDQLRRNWELYVMVVAIGWLTFPLTARVFGAQTLFWPLLFITVGWPLLVQSLGLVQDRQPVKQLAVAYRADLIDAVRPGTTLTPRFPTATRLARQESIEAIPSGPDPFARVAQALDRLDEVIRAVELPDAARRDLSSTSRQLRDRAEQLATQLGRLGAELETVSRDDGELATLSSRLDRLDTLARAGEAANHAERERLARAIEALEASRRAADQVEAEWVAATAQLFEIASTAAQIRRELLLGEHQGAELAGSADQLVERLVRDARDADAARREAARHQAQRLRQ